MMRPLLGRLEVEDDGLSGCLPLAAEGGPMPRLWDVLISTHGGEIVGVRGGKRYTFGPLISLGEPEASSEEERVLSSPMREQSGRSPSVTGYHGLCVVLIAEIVMVEPMPEPERVLELECEALSGEDETLQTSGSPSTSACSSMTGLRGA